MPAKKHTKKATPVALALPDETAKTGPAENTPRATTRRERFQNLDRYALQARNDANQAQHERDGLLALIAIAEGHGCIRRLNDEGGPF